MNNKIHLNVVRVLLSLTCLASIIGFYVYYSINSPTCLWDGATIYGIGDNNTVIKAEYCDHSLCNREICDMRSTPKVYAVLIESYYISPRKFTLIETLLLYPISVLVIYLVLDIVKLYGVWKTDEP